jgi:hypothetical protein
MLVYLFQNRTSARALTTDVTARNLPSRTAAGHWLFVKRRQINKCRPPVHLSDFNSALRHLDHYILTLKQLAPLRTVAASGRAANPADCGTHRRHLESKAHDEQPIRAAALHPLTQARQPIGQKWASELAIRSEQV